MLNVSVESRDADPENERQSDHAFPAGQFDLKARVGTEWDLSGYDARERKVRMQQARSRSAKGFARGQFDLIALGEQPLANAIRERSK
jgi:hypothetical protein